MKKIILILTTLTLIYACQWQKNVNQLLIGKWQIDNINVKNIDTLAQIFYSLQKKDLTQKIDYYKQIIDTIKDEQEKQLYEQNLSLLKQQLNNLSIDSIKGNIKENAQTYKAFEFFNDGTFSYLNEVDIEKSGLWSISENQDTITLKTNDGTLNLKIVNIDKNNLTVEYSEANGKINFDIELTLKKTENE